MVSSIQVDAGKCTQCGICVEICPLDLIRFDEEGFPYLKCDECWYCNACAYEYP